MYNVLDIFNVSSDNNYKRALELVKQKKIVRLNDFPDLFCVEGKTANYLVSNDSFCSCSQFLYRSLKVLNAKCYHLVAVSLLNKEVVVDLKPAEEVIDRFLLDKSLA